MATHRTALPWSSNNHAILARAADDPAFLADALRDGITAHAIHTWVASGDVPKTFRATMRALTDNWFHRQSFTIR